MLKSLYVEGTTPLHRLSVRVKLAGLFLTSLVLLAVANPVVLACVLAVAALVFASLRLPFRETVSRLGWMLVSIGIVAGATAFFETPLGGLVVFLRFTVLILLAAAITATTEVGDFMEEITRLMMPFERMGLLKAADIGLALGLVLRFVPEIVTRYDSVREAHAARGLPARPLSLIAPVMILTLKEADMIAMAIDARGLRRQ
jgi:biotin transport system permease protein